MPVASANYPPVTMAARLPAPRRRRQLLDVAVEVFGTSSYHLASMGDIAEAGGGTSRATVASLDDTAEAGGVPKPVLYQHFASKRELYLELLADVGNQLMEAV